VAESKFHESDFELASDHVLRRWQRPALGIGGLALGASLLGAIVWPTQFYQAWLVAFLYWLGLAMGSTALLVLQHITGGRWGATIRRPLEAAAGTVPLMALCFVPIVIGLPILYEWARPEAVAADHILQQKAFYLNKPFFIGRAAFYFVVWSLLSRQLIHWSSQQDEDGHTWKRARRVHFFSRAGIILYVLTITFAAIDWGMSLTPHWYSHIYGLVFGIGQVLTAMTLMIMVTALTADRPPMSKVATPERFHDLGKLLFAFVMVWGYFNLSQFMIMWSANIPDEVPWYLARINGGWQVLMIVLLLVHFCVPFALLLSRSFKRNPAVLVKVAALLLAARYLDLYWWIMPAFSPEHFVIHPMHVATVLGVGGVWFWAFLNNLARRPLLAFNDPVIAWELEKA